MRRALYVCFLLGIILIPCLAQNQRSDEPLVDLSYVMRVLSQYHLSGSFEYVGACQLGLQVPEFPKLHAPKYDSNSPVQILREVFVDYGNIEITQDSSGMIRIVEDNVPTEILDVKINHLTFKKITDPFDALSTVVLAKEVSAFKKAHNLGPEFFNATHAYPEPRPKSHSLSTDLHNVTLSQALDEILKTFPGLWTYENCPSWDKSRDVNFSIYQNNEGWAVVTPLRQPEY